MPLWRVKDDRGLRRHELASGFGHSLMLATLSGAFETLRISASVCDGPRWWSLHFEPSVITFELEHGIEGGRAEYDGANLARARQSRAPVCGTYSGFSDLFAPIVARGEVIATLVTGPFLLRRPTSRGAPDFGPAGS
jgi:hypothetical protein